MLTARNLKEIANQAYEIRKEREKKVTLDHLEKQLENCRIEAMRAKHKGEIYAPWAIESVILDHAFLEKELVKLGFKVLSKRRVENPKVDLYGEIFVISWDI